MQTARSVVAIFGLFFLLFLSRPLGALAQEATTAAFSRAQLSQMLAPIALYPDDVLSQILMASTYPIEVVEADRWLQSHQDLQGDALDRALQDKDWDASVKSLCHFPNVLNMMNDKIGETTNLGNAFLAQQDEVMDVVQELRHKALDQDNLSSNQKQKVIVQQQTIIIQPANPDAIYIPYYNPAYIYGSWWYPDYPPYYWGPANVAIGGGIYFWPTPFFGFGIGTWSYFNWPGRYIVIDVYRRPRFFRRDEWRERQGRWHHIPRHRRGVAYRDMPTARRFGQAPRQERHFDRGIRGFPVQVPGRALPRPAPRQQRAPRVQPRARRPVPSSPPQRAAEPQRLQRQKIEQQRAQPSASRQRVERQENNVFNRVEQGRREEERFSIRGRSSRRIERRDQQRGGSFRRDNRGDRDQRGRGR